MDISLENWLINNIDVIMVDKYGKIQFAKSSDDAGIVIKLCDFGLSKQFMVNDNHWSCNSWCGKPVYWSTEIESKKEGFNAKSNDIWCLGVCFFMLITGNRPWNTASITDTPFVHIMRGQFKYVLNKWNKLFLVNDDIIELFSGFFRYENDRITLSEIKKNQWIYGQ